MNGEQYVKELKRLHGMGRDFVNSLSRLIAEAEGDPNAPAETAWEPPADMPGGRNFQTVPPSEIRDARARSMTDLVTPKQLGMIRALAREAGVDPDEECQAVFPDDPKAEDLSKKAASSFIDHLKGLQGQRQPARRAS